MWSVTHDNEWRIFFLLVFSYFFFIFITFGMVLFTCIFISKLFGARIIFRIWWSSWVNVNGWIWMGEWCEWVSKWMWDMIYLGVVWFFCYPSQYRFCIFFLVCFFYCLLFSLFLCCKCDIFIKNVHSSHFIFLFQNFLKFP